MSAGPEQSNTIQLSLCARCDTHDPTDFAPGLSPQARDSSTDSPKRFPTREFRPTTHVEKYARPWQGCKRGLMLACDDRDEVS